jgi:3'-phosphoadenosine 5'-phosphosulfate sulfotransferase (PAPS reductase)/FAD synthetase
MREVAGQCANPALLFSGGKDSVCLLRIAGKAFRPARFLFSLLHIDTGHNYRKVTEFRDKRAAELGECLIVRSVKDSMRRGTVVLKHPLEARNRQTRRHAILASLVGIPHLVVAINKMDIVKAVQLGGLDIGEPG